MKNLIVLAAVFFTCLSMKAQESISALLPMPNEISFGNGDFFNIDEDKTVITFDTQELEFSAKKLQDIIQKRTGQKLKIGSGESNIMLEVDPSLTDKEQYVLDIDDKGITIRGGSKGAVYYGVITLEQILIGDNAMTNQNKIGEIHINDKPRFGYRAMMLDPARNFLPAESVKFFIDKMSQYKYNVLQLHLTDDQGWRVNIEKYPELASEEHYTKEELKDIIEYAEKRNVMVVPEVDVPGHTSALLSKFPEFKCAHMDTVTIEVGKTGNMMLCASQEKIFSVLDDVIKEIAEIFPSQYIHLGGDEAAVEKNWAKCPKCLSLMQELGYDKPSQLMIPFFSKVLKSVNEAGKDAILWCELDNIRMPANDYLFPYPKETTLVSWRNGLTPKCLELTHEYGNPIILAPGEYAYLDYPQYKNDFPEFDNWGMPTTTLEKSYQFDPGYSQSEEEQAHIMGIMATLWGEAIKNIDRATYMAYPRGLAISEAGWTQMENRDWESFKSRMYPNIMNLMKAGVSVRVPFEVVNREEQY